MPFSLDKQTKSILESLSDTLVHELHNNFFKMFRYNDDEDYIESAKLRDKNTAAISHVGEMYKVMTGKDILNKLTEQAGYIHDRCLEEYNKNK